VTSAVDRAVEPDSVVRPSSGPLQSVVKSIDLIEALVERGEVTAADLARHVGEPRSSVYRMLATLQDLGLVEVGSRRGLYRPGLGLVRLAGEVLTRFDERQLTLPVLEGLRAETKETVHLCLRRGFQAVFVERLPGERIHSLAVKLGGVLPLHVGAAPRALLAFEQESFWREYFASTVIEPWTDRSPASEADVRELLDVIRREGVAVSDEDVVVGVTTLGAPIFDHRGAVRAALAFNLLPGTYQRDRDKFLELARNASAEASLAFGYHLAEKGLPVPS
jgi:DNA-binding IclR family transcriptional regulator